MNEPIAWRFDYQTFVERDAAFRRILWRLSRARGSSLVCHVVPLRASLFTTPRLRPWWGLRTNSKTSVRVLSFGVLYFSAVVSVPVVGSKVAEAK